jgi:hypothetical protein
MKTNLIKGLFVVFALISCDSKKDKQDENQIPNSVYDNNKYYIEVDTKYSNNKNVLDFLQFKILPPIEEGELEIGIRTRTLRKQDSKIINYSLCGTYVSNRQSYTEDEYNDVILVLYNKTSYSGLLYGVVYQTKQITLPKIEKGKLYRYVLKNMRFELQCIDDGKK